MKKLSTTTMTFYLYKKKPSPMQKLLLISTLFLLLVTQATMSGSEITEDNEKLFQTITREHEDKIFDILLIPMPENNLELGLLDADKSLTENFQESLVDLLTQNSFHQNEESLERRYQIIINCLAKEKYWRIEHKRLYPSHTLPPVLANQCIKYNSGNRYQEILFLTPLAICATIGCLPLMNKLFQAGANLNQQNMTQNNYETAKLNDTIEFSPQDTPLHIVCGAECDGTADYYKAMSCLKFLLMAHANVNIQGKNGDTPLHRIAQSPFYQFEESKEFALQGTRMLLSAKADPFIKNNDDQTPLDLIAFYSNEKYELVQILKNAMDRAK